VTTQAINSSFTPKTKPATTSSDKILGDAKNDSLEGLAVNDTLNGCDDTLDGDLGIDSLVGGNGDNLYIMQSLLCRYLICWKS
jgi:Ca2+-binding RTX toxin-like protein